MSQPFIGEIRMFGGNFAPRSWALCDGQTFSIAQNQALFSLIGTIYGGDGRTTFGLPDLRGRLPMSYGAGLGLTQRFIGQSLGINSVRLTRSEMPSHNHSINATTHIANATTPQYNVLGKEDEYNIYVQNADSSKIQPMRSDVIQTTGGNIAHENRMPALTVNFIICLYGTYPSRS